MNHFEPLRVARLKSGDRVKLASGYVYTVDYIWTPKRASRFSDRRHVVVFKGLGRAVAYQDNDTVLVETEN